MKFFDRQPMQDPQWPYAIETWDDPEAVKWRMNTLIAQWHKQASDLLADGELSADDRTRAREIQQLAWDAMQAIQRGDSYAIAEQAVLLGMRVTEAHTLPFERPATVGQARIDGGNRGRATRTADADDRATGWQKQLDELRRLHPKWSRDRLMTEVARIACVSKSTIRRRTK